MIRDWEEDFIILSESWHMPDREIRRMSIYDLYFRIFTFRKHRNKKPGEMTEKFGMKSD